MRTPCKDLENFVFDIFGNSRLQFDFAVVFRVNDNRYQNILSTPIFFQIFHAAQVYFRKAHII